MEKWGGGASQQNAIFSNNVPPKTLFKIFVYKHTETIAYVIFKSALVSL